jgi:hypothetical protein
MADPVDEMVGEALWDERQGVWFSGPYRVVWSMAGGDWCLWYYADRTSEMLKRGFRTPALAKGAVEGHRELARAKLLGGPGAA